MFSKCLYNYTYPKTVLDVIRNIAVYFYCVMFRYYALMALFFRPQIHTLISSSHADLKSCTPNLSMTPPKTEILKNILCVFLCVCVCVCVLVCVSTCTAMPHSFASRSGLLILLIFVRCSIAVDRLYATRVRLLPTNTNLHES